jgi:hypothetical protein
MIKNMEEMTNIINNKNYILWILMGTLQNTGMMIWKINNKKNGNISKWYREDIEVIELEEIQVTTIKRIIIITINKNFIKVTFKIKKIVW